MVSVNTPDDAIRLAKQLAFLLKYLAEDGEIDLDETEAKVSADDKTILVLNAGQLVKLALGLKYGQLGEGEDGG